MIRFFLLALATPLSSFALAQNCAVKAHFRHVNSVNFNLPSVVTFDSGWQTTAPLVTPGANTNSNTQGCFSQGTCTTVSDYGHLSVVGAGAASTCSTGHVNLRLDSSIANEPKAQFRDRVTVVAPGLTPGTPVPLRCTVRFVGSANVAGVAPTATYRALFQVNGSTAVDLVNTPGTSSAILNVGVGNTVPLVGQLFATLFDLGVVAGPPNTASYSVDLDATFDILPLTPGVTLTYCSGASYNALSARATPVGQGCGAVPPLLTATPPALGSTCSMVLNGAPANALTFRGLSLGPATPIPLGACVLQLDPATIVVDLIGSTSPSGQLTMLLAIPNNVSLLAFLLTAQAAPLQAGGPLEGVAELSNGVELRLGF